MNISTIYKSFSIRLLKYTTMYNEIWDLDKNNNTSELTLIAWATTCNTKIIIMYTYQNKYSVIC